MKKINLKQKVASMQNHNKTLTSAKAHDKIEIKVKEKIRQHDKVYMIK